MPSSDTIGDPSIDNIPEARSITNKENFICAAKAGKASIASFTFPIEGSRLIGSRTLISVPRKLVTRNQQIII